VPTSVVNMMTVDVEDYFQVSAFNGLVGPREWPRWESRVGDNTRRLLEVFDKAGVRGTFFVLGWTAEHAPGLVREIADAGHELASHGYSHRLVYQMTPRQFRADLVRARLAIEDAGSQRVAGFRAPSFSITRASLWALDVLIEEGFVYDASIYPIHHDRYGIPDSPRHPYRLLRPGGGALWEVPGATVRCAGLNFPIGGGGYFRLLPYGWTRFGIGHVNMREGQPVVFYLHPWELDPDQPRLPVSVTTGIRHYHNLGKAEKRLMRLLREFRFAPIASVLSASGGESVQTRMVPALAH
jgi:polysaccharide deacetylase family protein (PEP-CTERM system associated)